MVAATPIDFNSEQHMKRPLGVTMTACLAFFSAAGEVVGAVNWANAHGIRWDIFGIDSVMVYTMALVGLLFGLIGTGLWKLRNWARRGFIALSVVVLAGTVSNLLLGRITGGWGPLWPLMVVAGIYALALAYMFTRNVKQAFLA